MLLLIYLGARGVPAKGRLLFALLATFFWTTLALAQDYRGTSEQRMLCTPDAFRLCAGYIPNGTKVENCLRYINKQIAHEMGIAISTVKVHRTNLMRKMKARSLPELSRMADILKSAPDKPQRS
jgi:hypothetical protein